jgi:hypothetical protein
MPSISNSTPDDARPALRRLGRLACGLLATGVLATGVLATGVLAACGPKTPVTGEAGAVPLAPLATPVPPAAASPVPVSTPPAFVAPPTPPPALVRAAENALALERRYFASGTTPDERMEIIVDLGALEAGETLGRIFRAERRWETRMKVLEVAGDLDSDRQHEPKLALLQAAVAPTQNRLIREVALDQLGTFEDPRAAALVDAIARADADRDLRAAAKAIRDARAAPPR